MKHPYYPVTWWLTGAILVCIICSATSMPFLLTFLLTVGGFIAFSVYLRRWLIRRTRAETPPVWQVHQGGKVIGDLPDTELAQMKLEILTRSECLPGVVAQVVLEVYDLCCRSMRKLPVMLGVMALAVLAFVPDVYTEIIHAFRADPVMTLHMLLVDLFPPLLCMTCLLTWLPAHTHYFHSTYYPEQKLNERLQQRFGTEGSQGITLVRADRSSQGAACSDSKNASEAVISADKSE